MVSSMRVALRDKERNIHRLRDREMSLLCSRERGGSCKWSTSEGGREAEWDEFREVNGIMLHSLLGLVNIF